MSRAVRATVTGRVQGVGFRYYTAEKARSLGVVGWVGNEPDGSVALHAEGADEAVAPWSSGAAAAPPWRGSATWRSSRRR